MPLTFGEKLKLEPVKITIRLPLEYIEQIDLLVRDMLYERTDLVLEKMEKKVELKRKMEHINKFRNEYLKQ
jgi:hypothetical protein